MKQLIFLIVYNEGLFPLAPEAWPCANRTHVKAIQAVY